MSDLSEINIRETNSNPFETPDINVVNNSANNNINNTGANRQNSAITNLQEQIGAAKNVMVSNIGKILERGENLDNLQSRSDDLQVTVS
jgi:hypothetical protein